VKDVKFINLRTYTHYTIGMGIGNEISRAKDALSKGHDGVAISDQMSLAGSVSLINFAKSQKVPVVIGVDFNITEDASIKNAMDKFSRVLLIAKNKTGLTNLNKLVTMASKLNRFYYKPRIGINDLIENKEGIIVVSGDVNSIFVKNDSKDKNKGLTQDILSEMLGEEKSSVSSESMVERFKSEFGDDLYLEISLLDSSWEWSDKKKEWEPIGINKQEALNLKKMELAKKYGIKTVITYPSYMENPELKMAQDIALSNSYHGRSGWVFNEVFSTKTKEEIVSLRDMIAPYIDDQTLFYSMNNTFEIGEKCAGVTYNKKPILPKVDYSKLMNDEERASTAEFIKDLLSKNNNPDLECLVNQALDGDDALMATFKVLREKKRMKFDDKEYLERLVRELCVIQRNGIIQLCDYFLVLVIIGKFVKDNKDKGFMQGPGRGSAAGCLVSWGLGIVDVDPIKWGLLFERFLVKERIGTFIYEGL